MKGVGDNEGTFPSSGSSCSDGHRHFVRSHPARGLGRSTGLDSEVGEVPKWKCRCHTAYCVLLRRMLAHLRVPVQYCIC